MDALMLFGGIIFISLGFSCLILTISYSRLMFTYLVLITIITDTFAMFFGMLIGKHKLCPDISPKKTGILLMETSYRFAFSMRTMNRLLPQPK